MKLLISILMIFGFAMSHAEEDSKIHSSIPNEMPEKVEDLLEATGLTWEEMREGASTSIDKKERFLERLQDEKILENLESFDVNRKTKEEIADYLNSLSAEKLYELHYLRQDLQHEFEGFYAITATTFVATTFASVMIGALAIDPIGNRNQSDRSKYLHKKARSIAGIIFMAGVPFLGYALYKTYQGQGLGLWWHRDDDKSIQENVKDYINSLTLEEAREALSDIKKINEELKKETE